MKGHKRGKVKKGKKTSEEMKLERIERETIRGEVRKEKYRKGN